MSPAQRLTQTISYIEGESTESRGNQARYHKRYAEYLETEGFQSGESPRLLVKQHITQQTDKRLQIE